MITLLDAGGAFLIVIPILMLIFLILAALLEGWLLSRFQYETLKKSFLYAILANIASVIVGWLMVGIFSLSANVFSILGFFAITLIVETIVFHLLNRDFGLQKTFIATLTANAASYLILLAFLAIPANL